MTAISFNARTIDDASHTASQCVVLPVFKDGKLSVAARQLDKASSGSIKATLKLGDFSGKSGEVMQLPGAGKAKRILLLGCGDRKAFGRKGVRDLSSKLYGVLNSRDVADALLYFADLGLKQADRTWALTYLARYLTSSAYRYTETISKPKPAFRLKKLSLDTGKDISTRAANAALKEGKATGLGVNDACDLANLPGNVCTPVYLASHARKLARRFDRLSATVLDEKKMMELGMGSLLSVSAGSAQPARLIVLQYKGAKASAAPYVLVGKGITFDSGGISIKPSAKMDEMKFDMGGAASVLGTMRAVAELQLPLNVIGMVAAAENMPGSRATKPGDVVTSMSGKTIEILNTDAEGRLVLCDALTYAERFKPAAVVDIATLTGAIIVALGSQATGLFSNNDALAEQLLSAGIESHDRAWRLPLWEEYEESLKSNFADVANIGGPGAGSITAASFLAKFTRQFKWAHLDIAGSAWKGAPKGATGRPVALLTRYLQDRVDS
ncbi:MAG: leucyl aminopeptidase [Pseudomonadota bacterium]